MKISKRGEYALRALIDLGIASELGWPMLQINELASKEKLPVKFLEQIFTQLKAAGYVKSRRGKFGGYALARPMKQVKFGEVIRMIDGPLAPIRCVSQTSYERCSCPDEVHCGLRILMFDVRNAISTILDRYTLADIVEITLRKYRRDKITPPFLHRSTALASILSPKGEAPLVNKRVDAVKHFSGSRGRQTHNGRANGAAKEKKLMLNNKFILRAAGACLAAIVSLAAQPLWAQTSSESKEIEELKSEVAELKQEVESLKKHEAPATKVTGDGPTKTEITHDGKTYVEKTVPLEKSSADKWKLSTSITEMELYGDVRLRYDYRGGETKDRGPVATPGAGVAGTNDWQERERERYRIRLGLRGTLLDDWFFGVRLETNNSNRSTNVTFGDDTASSTPGGGGPFEKNSDVVYVGQAYGGYKGFPDVTLTAGRMPNPLVIANRLVWDPDINPEGLAEQWKHTFVFGAEAPPPASFSKDSSKDGKAVAAVPSEPFLRLDVFANFGQFVYDDSNPENPLGARATTSANGGNQLVPNTDAFLLAWQVGARLNFPHNFYFQLAPTLYNYTGNGDSFNLHYQGGSPYVTNAASLAQNQTGINSLLVFDVPVEFGWRAWGIPIRIFGDFATNFEGNERADAAGNPGQGSQRYAYQAGLGIGQLKKKHDWEIDLWYQQTEQYALDPNLIDDDIFNAQENMQGIVAQATYNLTSAVNFRLMYAHGWWYNHNLGTGGNTGNITIATNPTNEYNLFQADLNLNF